MVNSSRLFVFFVFKHTNIKLFFTILVAIINVPSTASAVVLKDNIEKQLGTEHQKNTNLSSREIAQVIDNNHIGYNLASTDSLLITKKSGGRSRGGSFKRRPTRSSSPKRGSSSTFKRKKSTNSPNRSYYNQRKSTSPGYRNTQPTYREHSSPVYRPATRHNSNRLTLGNIIFFFIFLLFVGGLIFILFSIVIPMFGAGSAKNRKASKIVKERDNDCVTVSLLQVALSSAAENIQQDLSELSLGASTENHQGLLELMQEAVLTLLRNQHAWTHVKSSSNSGDINQAEETFDKLSITERSKFSRETLSNVDGQVKTRQARDSDSNDFSGYVVVTLILGTADDQPLFTKINTEEQLREVLLELSSMREDFLIKFELLWTPQTDNEYLTDEELLLEYTDLAVLV